MCLYKALYCKLRIVFLFLSERKKGKILIQKLFALLEPTNWLKTLYISFHLYVHVTRQKHGVWHCMYVPLLELFCRPFCYHVILNTRFDSLRKGCEEEQKFKSGELAICRCT